MSFSGGKRQTVRASIRTEIRPEAEESWLVLTGTLTAKFKKQKSTNYIRGYLSGWRHAGAIFTFTSTYTTTKNLEIRVKSQGDYEVEVGDRFETYPYYDDISGQILVLKAGQSEWKVDYLPGIDSGSTITSIQWQIVAQEDSDDSYDYVIEGNTGIE